MSHSTSSLAVCRFVARRLLGSALAGRVGAGPRPRRAPGWLVEPLEGRVVLATITVTSLADAGAGTLRAAVEQANLDQAQDTITFAPAITGTISLVTALPDLSTNITIAGPGPASLTVARNGAQGTPDFGIFTVPVGVEVTISGLTISGGLEMSGGGISNAGMLTLTGCTVSGNLAGDSSGGGIFNSGTLTLTDSTVSGNRAGDSSGGGIYNSGTLTLTDSTLSTNGAVGIGGGIDNDNGGTLTITHCTLSSNSVGSFNPGAGGGIANDGTLTLTDSTVSGNSASGGIGDSGGGGITNNGTLSLTGCTLSGNSAGSGGGVYNGGMLTATDCTLSSNSAGSGGIESDNGGTVTLTDCTLSSNSAGSGGGIYISQFGLGANVTATTSLFDNLTGGNLVLEAGAAFVSLGHNLFSDTPSAALAPTDLINTDPLLGPLADNGGPAFTQALLPGSPAIDAGVAVPGVTTDQRGVPRPQGSAPDIGAFESRGFTLAVVQGDNQQAPAGSAFPVPLVVSVISPFGEPVAGGQVTFAAPTTGASANLAANPVNLDSNGQASVSASANDLVGTYTVTAGAAGANSVAFVLTNQMGEPPTVVSLQRFGYHLHPTSLVLSFNQPMDPTPAETLGNYTLVAPGHGHRRVITLKAAQYNAATQAVTLLPSHLLNLHRVYQITVNGMAPLGLTDTAGVLLDGLGNGQPGTDFVALLRGFGLDKPAVQFHKLNRDQLGGKPIPSRQVNSRPSSQSTHKMQTSPALQAPQHSLRDDRTSMPHGPLAALRARGNLGD